MQDQYNRNINYMRISLTDRCNLRCIYCRPEVIQLVEHSEILRYEEILRLVKCAVTLGITRFKITGGEPLIRKGAVDFLAQLKQVQGVEQVTLTTNGMFLEAFLPQLVEAGLDGINISLDTLQPQRYRAITGGGELEPVLRAIAKAGQLGMVCKLNCVPLRSKDAVSKEGELRVGDNSMAMAEELLQLCQYAAEEKLPLRFIELMPLDCNFALTAYSGAELRRLLVQAGYTLKLIERKLGNGPAVYYEASKNQQQIIGFIEPLHGKFCASCNRVRLTSTGQLKPCLYSASTLDMRRLLRCGASDEQIIESLREAIFHKPMGHHFEACPASFTMNEIGG